MLKSTLRSMWLHKLRLLLTIVATMLGVAFMAGTLVVAATVNKVFDDLFADVNAEVDAQVQGPELFSSDFGGGSIRANLDESLAEVVASAEGVAAVGPFIQTLGFGATNRILAPDGEALGATNGPPTLLDAWIEDDNLNPWTLVEGRGPEADDEVAINKGAADEGGVAVGDTLRVITQDGERSYTLVGVFLFGTSESAAGAVNAGFTLAEAQRIAGLDGQVEAILVDAEEGVSEEEVVASIASVLPADVEVITGTAAAQQTADAVTSGFDFFSLILGVFAAIALIVGAFIISNTFAILVAGRTRELALLRAVGASRGQVMRAVLIEASIVGLTAALLGLLAGVGLAAGVLALFDALGADLPTTTLAIELPTIAAALIVGMGVTVTSALAPAVKATRVPPLAALREVAVERTHASRLRIAAGVLLTLVAALNLSSAWRSGGDRDALPAVGLGAFALLLAAVVLGPVLAGPTVRVVGGGVRRLAGVTGRLAVENTVRSPKRTSATASALLIGVALVGFITVFAESAKVSVTSEVERGFEADLLVQGEGGFGPPTGFPRSLTEQIAGLDGVEAVTALGFASGRVTFPDGGTADQFVTTVDPATVTVGITPRMVEGSITDLTDGGVVVDVQEAEDNGLAIGDRIDVTVPGGGVLDLEIQAISDDLSLLGWYTVTTDDFASVSPEVLDLQAFVKAAPDTDVAALRAHIEEVVAPFPTLGVLDQQEFVDDLTRQITQFVFVLYALLVLSVIIAVIGIVNTLFLSITERTRELGLLRAVGMSQRQVRTTVRWEAILISVLGALVGLGIGLVVSASLIKAMKGFGLTNYAVPIGQLVVIVAIAAVFGTLASLLPARRAAKLDILAAIATE